jgi:hypothetical protein
VRGRHVGLPTEDHGDTVGKKQNGGQIAVEEGIERQPIAGGEFGLAHIFRSPYHPEPVYLERADQPPAGSASDAVSVPGNGGRIVGRARIEIE